MTFCVCGGPPFNNNDYCLAFRDESKKQHVHACVYIVNCTCMATQYTYTCTCTCTSVGRVLCLEYRVSWVRVPPEAAHFF